MGVVLVVPGVVRPARGGAVDVVLVDLLAEILTGRARARQRGEAGLLERALKRDLQRPVDPPGHFGFAPIADPAHAIEERIVVGQQIGVLLGVVPQPEIAEAHQPLGQRAALNPPSGPALWALELDRA